MLSVPKVAIFSSFTALSLAFPTLQHRKEGCINGTSLQCCSLANGVNKTIVSEKLETCVGLECLAPIFSGVHNCVPDVVSGFLS